MYKNLQAVLFDEEGASLVEYALIVALVAVVAMVALRGLGTQAGATLSSATASMA